MAIANTKDYSEFALYEDNRVISQASIDKMVATIAKKNLLNCFPIVVFRKSGGKKYITDGQRRFLAAKKLGVAVWYIVCNDCTKDDIPEINVSQVPWKNVDYLHSFVVKAKQNENGAFNDYLRLEEFTTLYPKFNIANAICMLIGYNNQKTANDFKIGRFKIVDYHLACVTADNVMDMKSYHAKYTRTWFIRAMTNLTRHPQYDHKRMMDKMRMKHEDLLQWSTTNQYILNLQKIYNSHKSAKVSFIEE